MGEKGRGAGRLWCEGGGCGGGELWFWAENDNWGGR